MKFDLRRTPFSIYGSYFSVMQDTEGGPLTVRLLRSWLGKEKFLELSFLSGGTGVPVSFEANAGCIGIVSDVGTARVLLCGECVLAVESSGLDLRLRLCAEQAGYGYRESPRSFKLMSSSTGLFAKLDVVAGKAAAELPVSATDWFGRPPTEIVVTLDNGCALVYLETSLWDLKAGARQLDIEVEISATWSAWERFRAKLPLPKAHAETCEEAWYTLWAGFIRSGGNFQADACLMSKTGMGAVFSWDHCFNAMALSDADGALALDQFMLPFVLQAPSGQLPDRVTAREMSWLWVKPPIHGWSMDRILDRHPVKQAQLATIYRGLENWTNWWIDFRDTDNDGVPNYIFGCDVADNATLFGEKSFLLESPDLSACLVLQMRSLARLAEMMGDPGTASSWRDRASVLLTRMEDHLWNGERFAARISGSHEWLTPSTSLVPFRALILGELLEPRKFAAMAALLEKEHLSPHGLSSEALNSPHYEDDGYWRGSIWAPEVLMIVDGLQRGGRSDLAAEIARRFCRTVETSGFYECFNAKTGAGQRAAGYTWTASVYLLLMRDFPAS